LSKEQGGQLVGMGGCAQSFCSKGHPINVFSNGMRAAARLPQVKGLCSNNVKNFSNLVFVFESAFPGRIYQFQVQES
jgi:hypothetical protein